MTDSPNEQLPKSEPAEREGKPPASTEESKSDTGTNGERLDFGVLFPIVGAAGFFAFINDTSRDFIFRWWWYFAIGGLIAVIVAVIVVTLPAGRNWLKNAGATARAAIFSFVVLPFLLGAVVSVAVLPQAYQLTALRAVFFLVVCLLPAIMWFLFLATRNASLLNEFLADLDRLG